MRGVSVGVVSFDIWYQTYSKRITDGRSRESNLLLIFDLVFKKPSISFEELLSDK